jgi:hypothetical protein
LPNHRACEKSAASHEGSSVGSHNPLPSSQSETVIHFTN